VRRRLHLENCCQKRGSIHRTNLPVLHVRIRSNRAGQVYRLWMYRWIWWWWWFQKLDTVRTSINMYRQFDTSVLTWEKSELKYFRRRMSKIKSGQNTRNTRNTWNKPVSDGHVEWKTWKKSTGRIHGKYKLHLFQMQWDIENIGDLTCSNSFFFIIKRSI